MVAGEIHTLSPLELIRFELIRKTDDYKSDRLNPVGRVAVVVPVKVDVLVTFTQHMIEGFR